jgi:hypothetical protein
MQKNNLFTFLLCFFSTIIFAQSFYPSTQVWSEVDFTEKLSDKFVLQNDIQYSRQSNNRKRLKPFQIQPTVNTPLVASLLPR